MLHRVILRGVALVVLAAISLSFEQVGQYRILVATILLGLAPVPALLLRRLPQRRWFLGQSVFDVVAAATLVWLLPGVWAAVLVVMVALPAASAALIGRKHYVILEAVGLASVGLAAHFQGVQGWVVPLLVAVVMVPLVASYVEVFLVKERSAVAHLEHVADSASIVFYEVDVTSKTFISVSGSLSDVFGVPNTATPAEIAALLHPNDVEVFWNAASECKDDDFVVQMRAQRGDGSSIWLRVHVRRFVLRGRDVLRGVAFDVTELIDAHDEARRRAEVDGLTGLWNRAALLAEVERRTGTTNDLLLYVLDLDRFKEVNDTLGHQAGDEFLIVIANRLQSIALGGNTLVARLGGDEFAVVTDTPQGLTAVTRIGESLVSACTEPVTLDGIDVAGSASCGVAIAPHHGTSSGDLLRRADLAMYAAKRSGGGVHVFEFAADEASVSKLRLTSEIEVAIRRGDLRLWFQPKVHLLTGETVGAEGLLRWHHPERGVLAPAEFLDVVELSPHYKALTREVIAQGVAFAAQSQQSGFNLRVSVNVSIRDLLDSMLSDYVGLLLAEARVDPSQFILEVTEREIMDERSSFQEATRVLKQTGVGLAIDDFGTGYSSLVRLHQLPVTELKIDRRFVADLAGDPEAAIIVKSIVDLGHSLGHVIVAEGIETEFEAAALRQYGCDLGQGFLYSAAVPGDDLLEMLRTARRVNAPADVTGT